MIPRSVAWTERSAVPATGAFDMPEQRGARSSLQLLVMLMRSLGRKLRHAASVDNVVERWFGFFR
ncbi:MAG: hypothetical protein ACI8P0_000621 [Planctomycetaceae bacterium]|jgi:hypothetical protein